jgi:DNA-binding transcriptional LysR family regulator
VTQRYEVVPLTEVIVEFVRANMGFAILSQWAVKPYLKSKSLVTILLGANGSKKAT